MTVVRVMAMPRTMASGVDGGGGEEDHDAERGDGGGADRALVALGDGDEGGDERQERAGEELVGAGVGAVVGAVGVGVA